MKKVTFIIDGKEIKAQVKEEDLKEVEKKKGRAEVGENYYRFTSSLLTVVKTGEEKGVFDESYYYSGNYFLTEKECEDAARVVSLWLRMKRFADENNENSVDFNNGDINKYSIYFSFNSRCFEISLNNAYKDAFQIYFDSIETAQKAIDKFHDELMWYFTEYEKDNKTTTSKEIRYEVNVGSGCTTGTIFVDEGATDEEIRLAIMDDLYDIDYHEVVKEEN